MSTLEQTPTHSHIRHFFSLKWLWHIIYEDIIEKHFILPRLKEQKEALEKKYNSVKARENDPIVNRSCFRVITNERYTKID